MSRKPRWTESPLRNGVGVVRLSSWKYFPDFVRQEMLEHERYIWRGHRRSNWSLVSTLDRLMDTAKVARTKRPEFARKHLEQFRFSVRGRRGPSPPTIVEENDWWALGQHHGLATPLLDWTTSPFAAAYFAFINTGKPQTRFRAVYALSRDSVEKRVRELVAEERKAKREERARLLKHPKRNRSRYQELSKQKPAPEVEFIRPMSDENQRLVNQGGLFSRAPAGISLDQWVRKNFEGEDAYYELIKILIPNKDRHEALTMLNRMNINHLTLFPDLYGASKFCNVFGEIERY